MEEGFGDDPPGGSHPIARGDGDVRGPWPPGSLLAGLPEASRQRFLSLGTKRQYAGTGRVLIREGDHGVVAYLLLSGSVKVTAAADEGDALLAIRVGGDVVGEPRRWMGVRGWPLSPLPDQ